jgi:DhnA family fructose-bisphosphate aldolase class Ia
LSRRAISAILSAKEPTMPTGFDARAYLPREVYEGITDVRVRQPGFADGEADRRARRRVTAPDGKLVILAADEPGRASVGVPHDPTATGDRHEHLARVLRALSHAGVDGVTATPDVVEDLLILAGLIRERGGRSPLDERLLIGSMTRGGLPGTVSETDERFTAFAPRRMAVLGLDGGKLTMRIDSTGRGSPATIEACARAVSDLAEASLLVFLEPLPALRDNDDGYTAVRSPRALAEAVSAASAIGASSLYTWLALPACCDFAEVARATTLPLVIRGGEAADGPRPGLPMLEELRRGLAAGPNVRGVMIGPRVLHPGAGDPRAVAAAVTAIVRDGAGVDEALAAMEAERGKDPELV